MIALMEESSANFFSCPTHWLRRKNHAVKIDHADAVAEAAKRGFVAARVQRQIDQRKDGQYKEEKRSSSDQNPKQGAGTSFSHGESLAPGDSKISCVAAQSDSTGVECGFRKGQEL